jgi:formamidopyrimidine-DNA glycosylase
LPELPEVETVRRDLRSELLGRSITATSATGVRTFRRYPDVADVVARTVGRQLAEVDRRGKYLVLRLDSGDAVVIHLRMSGQLLVAEPNAPLARHTHAVFVFGATDSAGPVALTPSVLPSLSGLPRFSAPSTRPGPAAPSAPSAADRTAVGGGGTGPVELRFVDPRTFGEVFVTGGDLPELADLGVEPLDPALDPASLRRLLQARRVGLKALLLDQHVVVGIGNIYADEILWRARISPSRPGQDLTRPQATRLHDSIVATLSEAIDHRGSSLADEQYRDLYGRVGDHQNFHHAHGREGQPCPRCGAVIRRVRVAGRSTYFCPRCQR